jgi:hypothetical protein
MMVMNLHLMINAFPEHVQGRLSIALLIQNVRMMILAMEANFAMQMANADRAQNLLIVMTKFV